MSKQVDTLAELVAVRNECREVLQEMHGVLKDLKQARKEAEETIAQLGGRAIEAGLTAATESLLPPLLKRIEIQVTNGTNQAIQRIDKLTTTMETALRGRGLIA